MLRRLTAQGGASTTSERPLGPISEEDGAAFGRKLEAWVVTLDPKEQAILNGIFQLAQGDTAEDDDAAGFSYGQGAGGVFNFVWYGVINRAVAAYERATT